MENTCPGTPVQDERGLGNYSPVWDPLGDFALTQSGTDQLISRPNSLETIIRDQHMTTRENTSKALRECLCIERSMHEKTCKQLQLAIEGISAIRERHQADPLLMSGILGPVNSALLYLQTTTPAVAPAVSAIAMGVMSAITEERPSTSEVDQQHQQQQLQQQQQQQQQHQ